MCEPATIASLALSAASAGLTIKGQRDQASIEEAEQERVYEETQEAAKRDFALKANQETTALLQRDVENSREITDTQKQKLQAQATAKVSAGEAGVAGVSLDALLGDFERSEAAFADATRQQFEFDKLASEDAMMGHAATAQNRINAATPKTVHKPSYAGGMLRIAGKAVTSDAFKNQFDKPKETNTNKFKRNHATGEGFVF